MEVAKKRRCPKEVIVPENPDGATTSASKFSSDNEGAYGANIDHHNNAYEREDYWKEEQERGYWEGDLESYTEEGREEEVRITEDDDRARNRSRYCRCSESEWEAGSEQDFTRDCFERRRGS